MKSALIGFSGFIGSNLLNQTTFTDLYNSKNISDIREKEYDLIVSCGTSSLRWKADLEPQDDWKKIKELIDNLFKVKTRNFILISTVDVYPKPDGVDEDTSIPKKRDEGYGKNRYKLEQFVKKTFKKTTLIRLPQTFGPGLKKNFIYDLIHNNVLDFTHRESKFQWYNLENLWKDISVAVESNLQIVNFAVEPLTAKEVAKFTLGMDFKTITPKPPLSYDVQTKFAKLYGSRTKYIYNRIETLNALKLLIQNEKKRV